METNLPSPTTGRVYVNLLEGIFLGFLIHWNLIIWVLLYVSIRTSHLQCHWHISWYWHDGNCKGDIHPNLLTWVYLDLKLEYLQSFREYHVNIQDTLVGGLEHVLFFLILGIIIPTDFHIFQRGRLNHQPVLTIPKWSDFSGWGRPHTFVPC